MARGRRNVRTQSNFNESMLIWLALGAVIAVMATTFYLFGFDMGFIQFEGNLSANGLLVGGIICIALLHVCDVLYVRQSRIFFNQKPGFLCYIPYISVISLFDTIPAVIAWVFVGIGGVLALLAFSPIGSLLPLEFIQLQFSTLIIGIIFCMIGFTIVRGVVSLLIKRDVIAIYNKEINDKFGVGGVTSWASYVLYFLPIVRGIALYTDINLLKSVKYELDMMYEREE